MTKPRIRASVAAVAAASRPAVHARAYTAGSLVDPDLRRWQPHLGSADSDLLPERNTIVSRARDLERNHGVADGARQTYHDNIVGRGLRLSAKPNWKVLGWTRDQAEEWGNAVESLWCTFWDTSAPDVAGVLTGDGLTTQAFNSYFQNAEALALPLWMARPDTRWKTCLQMIDPDRLSNPHGEPNSETLRDGVKIDRYGRPLGYWIRNAHPGEAFFYSTDPYAGDWSYVQAQTPWGRARVIHAFDRKRIAQSRGVPALTSVLRQFHVLGTYSNSELKAAAVNAMVAMFTESALDQDGIVELLSSNPDALKVYQDGLSQRNSSAVEFTGGRIIPLRLGEKISSFNPNRPSTNFESFTTVLFRLIAAGLHIPYELLLKDFSKTNYSSARAALLEAWRFFAGRRKWLAVNWMQPIYRLFLEEAVDLGLVDAPDFYAQLDAYTGARWIGDGRGWVDPLREAEASALRMSLGIATLEDECSEQGVVWEEQLTQQARELAFKKKLETEYDIQFPSARPAAPAAAFKSDDDRGREAGKDKDEGDDKNAGRDNAAGSASAYTPPHAPRPSGSGGFAVPLGGLA